jgi:hypothetical protein
MSRAVGPGRLRGWWEAWVVGLVQWGEFMGWPGFGPTQAMMRPEGGVGEGGVRRP